MAGDVQEEWVSVVAMALGHTPHNRDTIRAALAAVAPLIRAEERDACMLIAIRAVQHAATDTTGDVFPRRTPTGAET